MSAFEQMQMAMSSCEHFGTDAPKANHPTIRLYRIDTVVSCTPLDDLPHHWEVRIPPTRLSFRCAPLHLVSVSIAIGMKRGCQQNDSLTVGWLGVQHSGNCGLLGGRVPLRRDAEVRSETTTRDTSSC